MHAIKRERRLEQNDDDGLTCKGRVQKDLYLLFPLNKTILSFFIIFNR